MNEYEYEAMDEEVCDALLDVLKQLSEDGKAYVDMDSLEGERYWVAAATRLYLRSPSSPDEARARGKAMCPGRPGKTKREALENAIAQQIAYLKS